MIENIVATVLNSLSTKILGKQMFFTPLRQIDQMLIPIKWAEGWAASVNPIFVAQSTRSIATLPPAPPGGMLVYHRVTSNSMSPGPIYKPGWRVTKWSKFLAYGNNGTVWLEFWPQDLNFPVLWTWQLNLCKFHSNTNIIIICPHLSDMKKRIRAENLKSR